MTDSKIDISTDRAKLDLPMIHGFLTKTYWADGRTMEQVRVSIDNSIPFGLFLDGEQIGFARVLTDLAVFAYLLDVFVVRSHRNNGYATMLMKYILEFPEFVGVDTWLLKTKDAHSLYERFGFSVVDDAERLMTMNRRENRKS